MRAWARWVAGAVMVMTVLGTTSSCALLRSASGPNIGPEIPGWTDAPTTPDPAFLVEAVDSCLLSMDMAPQLVDSLVIQDQRGPNGAAFLWVKGDEAASCFVSRDESGAFESHGASGSLTFPAPSKLQVVGIYCGPPTMVEGTLPTDDPSVVIVTQSGRRVHASVADGRFLAWWPGRDGPVSVESDSGGHTEGMSAADPSEALIDC